MPDISTYESYAGLVCIIGQWQRKLPTTEVKNCLCEYFDTAFEQFNRQRGISNEILFSWSQLARSIEAVPKFQSLLQIEY